MESTRRHTGATDLALTDLGRVQAATLAPYLRCQQATVALSSPRRRARETAELAGYRCATTDNRLAEWDYGDAESPTTADICNTRNNCSVWSGPIVDGESLEQVAERVDSLVATLRGVEGVDVILFSHAHLLRILAARWCRLPAAAGQHLQLDPASVSTLGYERTTPCILRWNVTPGNRQTLAELQHS